MFQYSSTPETQVFQYYSTHSAQDLNRAEGQKLGFSLAAFRPSQNQQLLHNLTFVGWPLLQNAPFLSLPHFFNLYCLLFLLFHIFLFFTFAKCPFSSIAWLFHFNCFHFFFYCLIFTKDYCDSSQCKPNIIGCCCSLMEYSLL